MGQAIQEIQAGTPEASRGPRCRAADVELTSINRQWMHRLARLLRSVLNLSQVRKDLRSEVG